MPVGIRATGTAERLLSVIMDCAAPEWRDASTNGLNPGQFRVFVTGIIVRCAHLSARGLTRSDAPGIFQRRTS